MSILSLQSHVVYGHVGNAAAVFPLQRIGFDVWPVHTVQFAAHTGYGPPKGRVFDAAMITDVMAGLAERTDFTECQAVLSGYMGSVEIGTAILDAVALVKAGHPEAIWCCDPVLGDTGRGFFVHPDIPAFMRECVVPQADILTPNLFELAALSERSCERLLDIRRAIDHLHTRGPAIIVVTSASTVETPEAAFDMLVSDGSDLWRVRTPRLAFSPNGAGDVMAALFLGHRLQALSPNVALSRTASAVYGLLKATYEAGAPELLLVAAQEEFVAPRYVFQAEKI